ncbi:MAG: PTS fructose-like transporter subunit IIB [Eubacteriaceae bacterium]|nr:PTS fructose-like transporter subunit IIB [Eubacteriaceae bacterium]
MKIVGVTACPSGVAHTYMAAEAIRRACKERNIDVKVETQGSIGCENYLTEDDIKDADAVILTKDIDIQEADRFKGKPIVKAFAGDVIKKAPSIVEKLVQYIESTK